MPCICRCGRIIDCGETECGICAPVPAEGLPNGMKAEDYDISERS